jgi:hypothetical protein
MNDGATVCKTCGRKQPASQGAVARRRKIAGLAVLAFVGVIAAGWFFYDAAQRQSALDGARMCAQMFPGKGFTPEAAQEVVKGFHDAGLSWRDAAQSAKAWTGCP